jgi:flavin reductase (DIM6/NTAB) family NADH-FMN oxidoreductase RutF
MALQAHRLRRPAGPASFKAEAQCLPQPEVGVELDFTTMDRRTAYFWMASTIAPRPVAWVSSLSAAGKGNLAPFSFFQMITPQPPTLMFCPQHHSDGSHKDTTRNIIETGEFVVNLVSYPMVRQMNETSFAFGADENEFDVVPVASEPSRVVRPPRVHGAPVSFECRLADLKEYPPASPVCAVILGEVVAASVDERIVGADGIIDPTKLDIVSRMGADWYGRTNAESNFTLPRPAGWAR